jgi:hypothetical protein
MSSIPQVPQSPVSQAQALTPTPAYTLFDSNAVGLATFFGWPVAGATLMLVNDIRLGRAGRGILVLFAAIVVTGLTILVGWNIPHGGSWIFVLLLLLLMGFVARKVQGAAVAEHLQRGGKLGSKWTAFWVGMAFFAVSLAIAGAIVLFPTLINALTTAGNGPKVVVGTRDEVFYTGSATQADATALGNALKADGYFTDKGVTVLLDKGTGGTTISFVVKEGIWDQPDMVASFDEIARQNAATVGGFPIKVRLVNKDRDVKNESIAGKESIGNDHIYYLGTATEAQAKALGESLKTAGFFEDKGFDVFLSKQSDGTTISFVVGDGAWDDASIVATFEKIARDAAPSVGGLPVRLRLDNTVLEAKKDELLK